MPCEAMKGVPLDHILWWNSFRQQRGRINHTHRHAWNLLAGANLIEIDFHLKEDRALFSGAQKRSLLLPFVFATSRAWASTPASVSRVA